ncbi:MAG: hypothetical protein FRX49_11536 [Trebouxia sp. A1-2]|nr:MAG: hypothetical protein FRX49_11536 [Trebouxia sp. A1-2]
MVVDSVPAWDEFFKARTHKLQGLGTRKSKNPEGSEIKLYERSITIKLVDGKAQLFWKQYMRDKDLKPSKDRRWPVFHGDVSNLSVLRTMPIKPISGFDQVMEHVMACSNIWDLVLEKDVTSSAASAPGSLTNDHRQKLLRDIKKSSSLWRQFIKEHEETWPKGTVSKMLAPPQRLATYPTGCKNKPADQDMDVPAIDREFAEQALRPHAGVWLGHEAAACKNPELQVWTTHAIRLDGFVMLQCSGDSAYLHTANVEVGTGPLYKRTMGDAWAASRTKSALHNRSSGGVGRPVRTALMLCSQRVWVGIKQTQVGAGCQIMPRQQPECFQNITANEHTMGSHDTVNNEGVGLRRAPPAMMRSDEPDTRPDLGSAWAGFYRDLETRNSYYDRLYKYGQPFNAETGQYISIAGMPFRQAVSLTCQPADLLKQTLCLAYSPPHASSETSNSSTFPPDTLPFVDSAPPPPHEYEHFLGSLLADTASDIPLPALGLQQTPPQHMQLQVPDTNAAAAPQGPNNQWQLMDALDLDQVLMQAHAAAASENSPTSPQLQLPTAPGSMNSHESGNTAAVLRQQSPPSTLTQHTMSKSLAGRGLRGRKRKSANVSPAAPSLAPSVSPAQSRYGDDSPAKKRRVQDESSAAQAAAPMQRATAEQLHLLNDRADSSPADRVFVVFYGKHDFNMVSQSRINMSFEDGLRKCKLKKGSALEVAVNEAINHIRARIAQPNQEAAQIYC